MTAVTTGPDPDGDGYRVTVDSSAMPASQLEPNGSITLTAVPAGSYEVRLLGVRSNCAVDGGAGRPVRVTAGQLVTADFAVTCVARLSGIALSTAMSRAELQVGDYRLDVAGVAGPALGWNDTVSLAGLQEGSHLVWLRDVAEHCAVVGPTPKTVAVAFGESATASSTSPVAPSRSSSSQAPGMDRSTLWAWMEPGCVA